VFFLLPPTQKVEKLTNNNLYGEFNCAKVKKSVKGRAEGTPRAYHGTRLRRTKHQRGVYRFVFFGGCWVRLRRTKSFAAFTSCLFSSSSSSSSSSRLELGKKRIQ